MEKKESKKTVENNKKNENTYMAIISIICGIISCIIAIIARTQDNDIIMLLLLFIELIGVTLGITMGIVYLTTKKKQKLNIIMAICGIIASAVVILNTFAIIVMNNNNHGTNAVKPIIYLYPEEEIELSVELGNANNVTCSYPKYIDGWKVLVKPDGTLIDLDTNRNLYALYYENENIKNYEVKKEGFIVKGCDSAEFLEEKLEILGLNEREAEEFIVYWLPKLEENEYNYIRFATKEEIEINMPLRFSTEPDTLIRILMTYKGLDKPIEVQEQKLETPKRQGFVAVEWGGTEIN